MRLAACCLLAVLIDASPAKADDVQACLARHAELTRRAEQFNGDAQQKRLIEADLKRARKEAAEGDEEECAEALDHATKLLAGGD